LFKSYNRICPKAQEKVFQPDNGGVNLVLSVLEDALLCRLLLVVGFLQLDLVDFDLEQRVGELLVVYELVPVHDILPLGHLAQHTRLAAGQRL
jgi:hypothetical protein